MVAMAVADAGMLLSIRAISLKTGISEPYLEQIFSRLRRDGLIDSVRGTQGGYRLAKNPDQITVGDVLRSSEGSLSPVRCSEKGQDTCNAYALCMTRPLWDEMSDAIRSVIDRQTLADIATAWKSKNQNQILDFSI